jgi:DNA polymerase elongation subunit (family B)
MIAYNICYSTLVKDTDPISDDLCHVIEWETHIGCPCDTTKRKSKLTSDKIFCSEKPFRYRFLKEPQGILPKLLKDLLDARTKTKKEMKSTTDPTIRDILDKRQLAFKVSANSVYGSLGTTKGYLPCLPCAMSTTAMGRFNLQAAAKKLKEDFKASLIYGD